jgi:ribokinase
MNIIVVGSINMDIVMKVPRLPQKGETLMAEDYMTVPGGKGANQAVAAARLGSKVTMVGALGGDAFGDSLLLSLQKENIDTTGVRRTSSASGNALITVDNNGDNTILVYPGANHDVSTTWIEEQEKLIAQADWVMLQLEIPVNSVAATIEIAKKLGKKILLNPAPAVTLPEELYASIDLITPNETELRILSGKEKIRDGAAWMIEKGVKCVIVTLGAEGSFGMTKGQEVSVPAYPVKPVDSTAAGDAFNAAVVIALSEGNNLKESMAFANAAGGLTTTVMGAQRSLPDRNSLDQFLAQHSS